MTIRRFFVCALVFLGATSTLRAVLEPAWVAPYRRNLFVVERAEPAIPEEEAQEGGAAAAGAAAAGVAAVPGPAYSLGFALDPFHIFTVALAGEGPYVVTRVQGRAAEDGADEDGGEGAAEEPIEAAKVFPVRVPQGFELEADCVTQACILSLENPLQGLVPVAGLFENFGEGLPLQGWALGLEEKEEPEEEGGACAASDVGDFEIVSRPWELRWPELSPPIELGGVEQQCVTGLLLGCGEGNVTRLLSLLSLVVDSGQNGRRISTIRERHGAGKDFVYFNTVAMLSMLHTAPVCLGWDQVEGAEGGPATAADYREAFGPFASDFPEVGAIRTDFFEGGSMLRDVADRLDRPFDSEAARLAWAGLVLAAFEFLEAPSLENEDETLAGEIGEMTDRLCYRVAQMPLEHLRRLGLVAMDYSAVGVQDMPRMVAIWCEACRFGRDHGRALLNAHVPEARPGFLRRVVEEGQSVWAPEDPLYEAFAMCCQNMQAYH